MLALLLIEAGFHQGQSFTDLVEVDGDILHALPIFELRGQTRPHEVHQLLLHLRLKCKIVQLLAQLRLVFVLLHANLLKKLGSRIGSPVLRCMPTIH